MSAVTIVAPSKEITQEIKDKVAAIIAHCTIKYKTLAEFFRSPLNVRKKRIAGDDGGIPELAALLRSQGLLQNLVGYDDEENGKTGVVAGGRRLEAIEFNIVNGYWPDDMTFPYLLVSQAEAVAVSLAENSGRKDMHHADIVVAMLELSKKGISVDDIGLAFGVEPLRVRQRLKLGNMSPVLFNHYHNDELDFAQMIAYAITDDHEKQESTLKALGVSAPAWKIKQLLSGQNISVTDSVVKFVGLDNFKKAGGIVIFDLFNEKDTGSIEDKALLTKMAAEKLEKEASKLAGESHAWIECRMSVVYADKAGFIEPRKIQRALTDGEKENLSSLENEIVEIEAQIDEITEGGDDVEMQKKLALLNKQKRNINDSILITHPGDVKLAGTIVTIDTDGKTLVIRNVIRSEDKKKMDKIGKPNQSEKPKHSDRLTKILTSHRTVALQAELLHRPDVALVIATHAMIGNLFRNYRSYGNDLTGISLREPALAEEAMDSAAYKEIIKKKEELNNLLPKNIDSNDLFKWMMEQNQEVIFKLLAYCTAVSCDFTLQRETTKSAAFLNAAQAVELDMGKWWQPTPKNYFNHVSKENMMDIVKSATSVEKIVPMEKMKKSEAAQAATLALAGAHWLPEMLRVA